MFRQRHFLTHGGTSAHRWDYCRLARMLPRFGGWSQLDLLAQLYLSPRCGRLRDTFKSVAGQRRFRGSLERFLRQGMLNIAPYRVAERPRSIPMDSYFAPRAYCPKVKSSAIEIVFPRRITKLTMAAIQTMNGCKSCRSDHQIDGINAVQISVRRRQSLQVADKGSGGDLCRCATIDRDILDPPGQADFSLSLSLGYGAARWFKVGSRHRF